MALVETACYTGEFILSEGDTYSRDEVTFAAVSSSAIEAGTLVGIVTASGHYATYSDAASDGTQTCVGITYSKIPVKAGTQKGVIISRECEVIGSKLTGLDSAGTADLKAIGIIVR